MMMRIPERDFFNDRYDAIGGGHRLSLRRNSAPSLSAGTPSSLRTVSASLAKKPDQALGEITRQQLEMYNQVYRPLNQQLMREIDSTALVDTAKEQVSTGTTPEEALARSQRQAAKFGVGGNALDLRRSTNTSALAQATDNDGLINNARVAQFERNQGLREELAAIGRGIATSSNSGLNTAADLQTQRNMNNANIKAQNSAQKTQMAGTIASMAMMAAAFF